MQCTFFLFPNNGYNRGCFFLSFVVVFTFCLSSQSICMGPPLFLWLCGRSSPLWSAWFPLSSNVLLFVDSSFFVLLSLQAWTAPDVSLSLTELTLSSISTRSSMASRSSSWVVEGDYPFSFFSMHSIWPVLCCLFLGQLLRPWENNNPKKPNQHAMTCGATWEWERVSIFTFLPPFSSFFFPGATVIPWLIPHLTHTHLSLLPCAYPSPD